MDPGQSYTPCPYCRKPVDPDAPGVVYAVSSADVPGFGQEHDIIDGRAGFFHPGCRPGAIGYVPRDPPGQR
jgi:hypothetical protein